MLLLATVAAHGQNATDATTAAAINQQVWLPFIEAYRTANAQLYNSLHTNDVLRVTARGIKEGQTYKAGNTQRFAKRHPGYIDFRFEHCIHHEGVAYEVGYYQLKYTGRDGQPGTSYGRFHVVLRQVNGTWQIAQDWDTGNVNGHEVTAADFERLPKPGW